MSSSTRERIVWTSSSSIPPVRSLIVEDNGIGFNPSNAQTAVEGLGLIGMRERAALAGADFRSSRRRQWHDGHCAVPAAAAPTIKST